VVSGTSFLTTVLIARWADASQLGTYAIGISILASILAAQDALIVRPYSIKRHQPVGSAAEHAGGSLALSVLLSAICIVVLVLALLNMSARHSDRSLLVMGWALAAAIPFALVREFSRQFSFAHFNVLHALLLDATVAGFQLSIVAALGITGHMSAGTACAALGSACAFGSLSWLYFSRQRFAVRPARVRSTLEQSWSLGKWLLAAQMAIQVQGYITYWLLMGIAGAAVTGIYAACMSIVSFANPIMFGFGNVLMPRSVLAWKSAGGAGLRREALRNALLLAAVMGSFCVFVAVAGESLMHLFYRGVEFEDHGLTLTVLAAGLLPIAVGMPASNALAAMERPRAIVTVGVVAAAITLALVWGLMLEFGLLGAAYGSLAGNLIGALGRWVAFLALVPARGVGGPIVRVLSEVTGSKAHDAATITRLGEGDFATVFLIAFNNGEAVLQGYKRLVVKVYKDGAGALGVADATRDAQALSRLHAALIPLPLAGGSPEELIRSAKADLMNVSKDAGAGKNWTISAPKPVHVCEAPLALVMTAAPGRDIDSCLASREQLNPELLQSAARAFVTAMTRVWSRGELHGDLGLRNVLFDVRGRQISLVDPGTRQSCRPCGERTFRPAVSDLGHLLCELATDVTDVMGHALARARKQVFVETAIASYAATFSSSSEKEDFVAELWLSAQAHLAATLAMSWTPHGLWHRFVKLIALHRIRTMLESLS
jgi:O-antigen/teichoic acid export membrane protein